MPRSFYTLLAAIVTLAPTGCAGPILWFGDESLSSRRENGEAIVQASDEEEPETQSATAVEKPPNSTSPAKKSSTTGVAISDDRPSASNTPSAPAKLAADQQVGDRATNVTPPANEPQTDPAITAQVQALGFDDPAEELAALAAIQAAPAAHRAFLLRTMQASLLARGRTESRSHHEPRKLSPDAPTAPQTNEPLKAATSEKPAPDRRLDRHLAQDAVVAVEVERVDDSHQDETPKHTAPSKPDVRWRGPKNQTQQHTTKQEDKATVAEIHDEQDWQAYVDEAVVALEEHLRDATDKPNSLEQARLRLLYLVSGRRDDAVAALNHASPAETDFWSKELFALGTLFDESHPDRTRRAALASEHFREAADRLGELGGLVVKNAHFCTEVKGYGTFTAFPKDEFRLGQEVLLYCEVENFQSKPTDRGHHTALKGRYQIFDAAGNVVAEKDLLLKEEHCQNKRRDFFIPYFVWMPKQIPSGSYRLKLTIEDVHAQQMAETSIDFAIKEK